MKYWHGFNLTLVLADIPHTMPTMISELLIDLARQDLEKADVLFPEDKKQFDQATALAWLLRNYRIFRPLILGERLFDYSLILSRLDGHQGAHQTKKQTHLDLYSAAGQITSIYGRFDQRKRA